MSGGTVQVMYDYGTESSKRVPDDVRGAIAEHDGPFGRGGRWVGAAGPGSGAPGRFGKERARRGRIV